MTQVRTLGLETVKLETCWLGHVTNIWYWSTLYTPLHTFLWKIFFWNTVLMSLLVCWSF